MTGFLFFEDDCNFYLHRATYVVYYILAIVIYFFGPAIILPYVHAHILYVVCASYKKIKNAVDAESRNANVWTQIKLSAMLMYVYLSFIIAYLPYFVLFIMDLTAGPVSDLFFQLASYLMNVQATASFVIYGMVSPEFRNAYKQLLNLKVLRVCRDRRSSITVSPLTKN